MDAAGIFGRVTHIVNRFLLTRLPLESLVGKRSPRKLRDTRTLPSELDNVYKEAMNRIEGQNPDHA